jgi:hypothetical protein
MGRNLARIEAMRKSSKKKTPKIDPRLLVRPRIDALLDRYAGGALDDAQLQAEFTALMTEAGYRLMLEALLKRLETAPAAERASLPRWAAPFKQPESIAHLWQLAKDGLTIGEARRASLELLQALGEEADPVQADKYAPPPAKPKPVKGWPIELSKPEKQPRTPEQEAADERWEEFESADLAGKIGLFKTLLPGLESYDAFDVLAEIRDALQPGQSAEGRAQFAVLVEKLRATKPVLYADHQAYYAESLLIDAVTDGRWEALRPLLEELCAEEAFQPDSFFKVIDALRYHGQTPLLLEVLPSARQPMNNPEKIVPGAGEELDGIILLLILLNYVSVTPEPRADDPALQDAAKPYMPFKAGWVESFLQHLAKPTPWTPADFGDAVDAEQWEANLFELVLEFMADQLRKGAPLSRAELAYHLWYEVLCKQMKGAAPASLSPKKKTKGTPRAPMKLPLVPQRKVLDAASAELLNIFNPQAYKVGAAFMLLPVYLHFVARRGLLARPDLAAALKDLKPLAQQVQTAVSHCSEDGRLLADLEAAWADQHLARLAQDPVVPETIVVPLPPAPRPVAQPGACLTYLFRVTYRNDPDIWRTVELREAQTLRDLHHILQDAFEFDDDHLYSFYLSGEAWDKGSEYAAQPERGERGVGVPLSSLPLRPKQTFLYLCDYGDQHEFDVQFIGLDPNASKHEHYPRIAEVHGKAPAQYGAYDDEEAGEGQDWDEEEADGE